MAKSIRYAFVVGVAFVWVSPVFAQKDAVSLIEALREDDDATALVAQNQLVQMGPEAVKPLEKALSDGNFKVRRRAAETLGRLGPLGKHAAPELVLLLADPQFEVSAAADKALIQMGDDAVPALGASLKSDKDGLRKLALSTLSRCGPKGIPILIQLAKKDESVFIRANAAQALGETHPVTPEILDALIHCLSDLEEGVRGAAADSLGQLGTGATAAIGPLVIVAQADKDALTRQKAVDALARIGPATKESMAGLIAALRYPSVDVRRQIIQRMAISTIPFADASPALTSALKDEDAGVRLQVVQTALSLGGTGATPLPILRQTINDPSIDVRSAAIDGLGRLKDAGPEAARELERLHSDPNPVIRQNAIRALAKLGVNGLPGLIQGLSDPYSALSEEAGKAIVRLGPDAIASLQALEQGPDPILKQKAHALLRRIQQKPAQKHR